MLTNSVYQQPAESTFNIVFSINNILADTSISSSKKIPFYEQKGFVLTAVKTHYIFPGVIELMQLLFQMPDVRVSFFSSAHQCRNEPFVERLLEHALGAVRYREIKQNVLVLSGKKDDLPTDLVNPTNEADDIQWQKYHLHYGNQKKSLEKVVRLNETLDNSVLIDSDSSFIKCGQERNYLYVPGIRTYDYAQITPRSMHDSYTYETRQGTTTAIDLESNRICYIAGVLFKAIEHARRGSTLADFLFPLHFLPSEQGDAFKPRFHIKEASHNHEEYYHYGLEKLRQVNPRFTFITSDIYENACTHWTLD